MDDNINISPEMINNFVNMLKNTETNSNTKQTSNQSINFTDIPTDTGESNTNSIDFETILKIKSIMETLNTKNDPRSNLLYSLKPYLRESKRSKLDQYANLLKITQVTGLFKNEKEK